MLLCSIGANGIVSRCRAVVSVSCVSVELCCNADSNVSTPTDASAGGEARENQFFHQNNDKKELTEFEIQNLESCVVRESFRNLVIERELKLCLHKNTK